MFLLFYYYYCYSPDWSVCLLLIRETCACHVWILIPSEDFTFKNRPLQNSKKTAQRKIMTECPVTNRTHRATRTRTKALMLSDDRRHQQYFGTKNSCAFSDFSIVACKMCDHLRKWEAANNIFVWNDWMNENYMRQMRATAYATVFLLVLLIIICIRASGSTGWCHAW